MAQISIAKHRSKLTTEETLPTQCAAYSECSKAGQFEIEEIDKMLSKMVIEPALTEWIVSIVLASEKDGFLRFFEDYHKLNAVAKDEI